MPIQLNYTDPNTGINASTSYWYIVIYYVDRLRNEVAVQFGGYKDLASKQAGKIPAFPLYRVVGTLSQFGITGATTANQIISLIESFALTYTETQFPGQPPLTFFAGGVIV